MRASIIATVLAALTTGAAAQEWPLSAHGSLAGCDAHDRGDEYLYGPDDRLYLLLEGERLLGYEWACEVSNPRGIGNRSWRVDLSCTGEGEEWAEVASISLDHAHSTASIVSDADWSVIVDSCSLPFGDRVQREALRLTRFVPLGEGLPRE